VVVSYRDLDSEPTSLKVHGEQRGAFMTEINDSRLQRGDLVCA
jgi:hypothetical protein